MTTQSPLIDLETSPESSQVETAPETGTADNWTAVLALCLALLAVSFAPIFIRFSETELGPNGTVLNRLLIFLCVFGPIKVLRQRLAPAPQPSNGSADRAMAKPWGLLVAVGLTSITTLGLWAVSLEYTTVAKSMLLNNLTPVFTSLGGWLFLRQRFDGRFLLGLAIALMGAIALGLEDLQGGGGHLIGDFYALLSAVFLGIYFLTVEQLRSQFSAITILLWRCAIGSGVLLPLVWFVEGQLFPTTWNVWLAVIGLGLISEGLGQRLLADCMDKLSSRFVSLFLLLEPIVSAVLAWMIFAEQLSLTTWLGFAVVLTGIYLAKSSRCSLKMPAEELG